MDVPQVYNLNLFSSEETENERRVSKLSIIRNRKIWNVLSEDEIKWLSVIHVPKSYFD